MNLSLKQIRVKSGYSQERLAFEIGVTQSTLSKYETNDLSIPDDVFRRLVVIFPNARLIAEYEQKRGTNLINIPILNNVDDNNVTVIDATIEEAHELIDAALCLKKLIRNKKAASDFTKEEWQQLIYCEGQILDILPAIHLHLIRMNEQYDLNISLIEKNMTDKLIDRKYVTRCTQ